MPLCVSLLVHPMILQPLLNQNSMIDIMLFEDYHYILLHMLYVLYMHLHLLVQLIIIIL